MTRRLQVGDKIELFAKNQKRETLLVTLSILKLGAGKTDGMALCQMPKGGPAWFSLSFLRLVIKANEKYRRSHRLQGII